MTKTPYEILDSWYAGQVVVTEEVRDAFASQWDGCFTHAIEVNGCRYCRFMLNAGYVVVEADSNGNVEIG